jgi:hypothetical protein
MKPAAMRRSQRGRALDRPRRDCRAETQVAARIEPKALLMKIRETMA